MVNCILIDDEPLALQLLEGYIAKIPFMNLNHLSRTYVTSSLLLIFLLCFFGAAIAQPGNNACGSATPLTPGTTCTSTAGTLRNGGGSATSTAGISAFCGNANSPGVWYSFVATSVEMSCLFC